MARAEALLPHPAAAAISIVAVPMDRIPKDLSKGEPWSDHKTDHPSGTGSRSWQQVFRLLPFSFPDKPNINRR
jgi:hypothetical protein